MKRKLMRVLVASFGLAVLPWNALAAAGELPKDEKVEQEKERVIESVFTSKRGYVGIVVLDLTDKLRKHFGAPADAGVLVSDLTDDGPAAKAGVQVGDVIVSVDGQKVGHAGALRQLIAPKKAGAQVKVGLVRERKERTVTAAVTEREMPHIVMRRWGGDQPGFEGTFSFPVPPPELVEGRQRLEESRKHLESRLRELEQRLKDLEKKLPEPTPPSRPGSSSERL